MSLLILCVILTRHRLTLPPETVPPVVVDSTAVISGNTMPRMIRAVVQDSPPAVLPRRVCCGKVNVQQQAQRRPSNRYGSRGQAQPDRLHVRSHGQQDCGPQPADCRQDQTDGEDRGEGIDAAFVAIAHCDALGCALLTHLRAGVKNVARRWGWWSRPFPTNPLEAWTSGEQDLWDAVMRRGKYRRLFALSQYHRSEFGLLRHSCHGDIK